jgi:predicted nuclease of predicted toxin-antitoxin system
VAESVCKFLEERGYEVTRLRTVLPTDTPDPIVAKTAETMEAILISDDADFNVIAGKKPTAKTKRFKKLSRVNMRCQHSMALSRLAAAMTLIEFEFEEALSRSDKRMIIDVQPTLIRTLR